MLQGNFKRPGDRPRLSAPRRGFTLVELLVVITIIIILAGLTIPAVMWAIGAAQETRIRAEVNGLNTALEQYRNEYGDFPPDFSNQQLVLLHWQKRFPRTTQQPPSGLTRAEALVFWLQGFSPNPLQPLSGETPLFPFDKSRLKLTRTLNGRQIFTYVPQDGQDAPYVYFAAPTYANASNVFTGGLGGTARPYRFDQGTAAEPYANPTSFQIISAGMDGNYGSNNANKSYPSGNGYDNGDFDNITNFCTRTLGDDRP